MVQHLFNPHNPTYKTNRKMLICHISLFITRVSHSKGIFQVKNDFQRFSAIKLIIPLSLENHITKLFNLKKLI